MIRGKIWWADLGPHRSQSRPAVVPSSSGKAMPSTAPCIQFSLCPSRRISIGPNSPAQHSSLQCRMVRPPTPWLRHLLCRMMPPEEECAAIAPQSVCAGSSTVFGSRRLQSPNGNRGTRVRQHSEPGDVSVRVMVSSASRGTRLKTRSATSAYPKRWLVRCVATRGLSPRGSRHAELACGGDRRNEAAPPGVVAAARQPLHTLGLELGLDRTGVGARAAVWQRFTAPGGPD